jgi:hypothetical protein
MKNFNKINKILKIAQSQNTEAWLRVKEEAENSELPSGIIDMGAIEESNRAVAELTQQATKAKEAIDSLGEDEKKMLGSAMQDPKFWEMANAMGAGQVTAASLIDSLFVKYASQYIERDEAIEILREINIYKNLNSLNYKVASSNSLREVLAEKENYFLKMCNDKKYLAKTNLMKIAFKYEASFSKKSNLKSSTRSVKSSFATASPSLWDKFMNSRIGWGFKFIGTVLPFVGLYLSAKNAYEAFENIKKAEKAIGEHFSEFGNIETSTSPDNISSLIQKHGSDPEKLLKITQLNKVAEFYTRNCWSKWFEIAMFISDLIYSVGIVIGAFTGGIGAVIAAPLHSLVKGAFLRGVALVAGVGGGTAAVSMGWFDVGVGKFIENKSNIISIANSHLGPEATSDIEENIFNSESDEEELSDEEALMQLRKMMGK